MSSQQYTQVQVETAESPGNAGHSVPIRICTIKELRNYFQVSESTIRSWIQDLNFPKPFQLGHTKNYWRLKEVDDWIDSSAQAADTPTKKGFVI